MFKKLFVLAFVTLCSLHALEKEGLNKDVLERIVQPKLSFESSYISDADVSGSDGSVAVHKNTLRLNNEIFGISYSNWAFDWNDVGSLPFGNGVDSPLDEMHSIRLNATLPYKLDEKWFLLAQLSLNSTFEKELSDSYGGGLLAFASYKLSNDHSLQFGAFANYHPITTLALPVVSYSYRAKEKDGFVLVLGFPRTYAGYFINSKTMLRTGMIFSQSVIKLAKDSTLEQNGYAEAKDYMANIGATYELNESFRLEADLLYSLKRDFILYNSDGVEQNEYGIDSSLGFNFRLRYLF